MINRVWLGWTGNIFTPAHLILDQILKISFGDVKNFGFQILNSHSRYIYIRHYGATAIFGSRFSNSRVGIQV